jgi:DUF1009 family protein
MTENAARGMPAATATGAGAGPLGIVCGGGEFPVAVADAVARTGRPVVLIGFYGFASHAIERFPHEWTHFGAFGRLVALMRKHKVRDIVAVGSVHRPHLRDFRLDWTTLRLLPRLARLYRGGDDHLLSGVAGIVNDYGFRMVSVADIAPGMTVPEGVLGRHRPSDDDEVDIRFGHALLRALGPFDVGQAAAVSGKRVLAVEAAEGTAGMMARLAEMRVSGKLRLEDRAGILVKAPKPGQDRRIDLPAVGIETVSQAVKAGLRGIAVEAGGTIVPDLAAMVAAADKAGIFLVGVRPDAEPSR